jgi:hypothetical protein
MDIQHLVHTQIMSPCEPCAVVCKNTPSATTATRVHFPFESLPNLFILLLMAMGFQLSQRLMLSQVLAPQAQYALAYLHAPVAPPQRDLL